MILAPVSSFRVTDGGNSSVSSIVSSIGNSSASSNLSTNVSSSVNNSVKTFLSIGGAGVDGEGSRKLFVFEVKGAEFDLQIAHALITTAIFRCNLVPLYDAGGIADGFS
jgi:hypothetical protein